MLEKLRNNPRMVVVALVAAGILAIAVAAGNNNTSNQPAAPEGTPETSQSDSSPQDTADGDDAQNPEEATPEASTNESSNESSAVTQGTSNVDVRSEAGSYKTTVKAGNNQTVVVRKMVADYLAAKSETLSDEQKLYIETTIVSQLPRKDRIYPGEEIAVSEELLSQMVGSSKQLSDQQIKRWSAYL